jgi:hypothetical protein
LGFFRGGPLQLAFSRFDGVRYNLNRRVERNRELTDEPIGSGKIACTKLVQTPKPLGHIVIAAAMHQLDRSQSEFITTAVNKGLDRERLLWAGGDGQSSLLVLATRFSR